VNPTFLLELPTDDTDLVTLASEIQDALLDFGFNAVLVKPYKRQPSSGLPSQAPGSAQLPNKQS
jgi:hypothetical protein